MGTLLRLRIALADRPGSLAQVASIIAEHGGNITAVDVHQSTSQSAVDDVVVDFPEEGDVAALRADLANSGAATLLSHQAAHASDPVVGVLRRAAEMIGNRPTDPEPELVRSVAELCSSPAVWVCSVEMAYNYDAGRFALERNGAIAVRTDELPVDMAERLPGEVWLLAVPDPELTEPGRVVFVARSLGYEFTSTEIARIEALMALHDQVEALLTRR